MMAATNLFERSPFARVMADVPVTVYDVGARGGVDLDLLPLAFAVDAAVRRLLKAALIAMGYGFFDHAALILERPAVAAFFGDRYAIRAAPALRRTSRMYARHLRGLGPYVRTTARLLR